MARTITARASLGIGRAHDEAIAFQAVDQPGHGGGLDLLGGGELAHAGRPDGGQDRQNGEARG